MISRIFFAGFLIVSLMSRSANAEYEIGVSGQSGWSDNFYLDNPDGWGITLSKRVSPKVAIRFSFSRFDHSFIYRGNLSFGLLPPEINRPPELINSDASANFYEFSLHHVLVSGNKMRLEAGAGFGGSNIGLNLVGNTTNRIVSTTQSLFILTFSIDATVKKLLFSPFSLRFGYQYRTMGGVPIELDGFQPFSNVKLSGVRVVLLVQW